ncbi:MAG: hypothetical protein HZA02_06935 [Nitrospinae bacterium]|nr:hypothetical protein [Nitrospinota bacterium]
MFRRHKKSRDGQFAVAKTLLGYVKELQLKGGKTAGLIAESENNLWVGLTFFDKGPKGVNNLRRGRLLYARGKT